MRTRLNTALITALISLVVSGPAQAAPSFPDYPLVSGAASAVPPNLMLILDDSGSMQFTFMADRALNWGKKGEVTWTCYLNNGQKFESYWRDKHGNKDWVLRNQNPGSGVSSYGNATPCGSTESHRYLKGTAAELKHFDNWIFRSYINNTIYYNPAVTYLPWRTHTAPPADPATPLTAPLYRMENANVSSVSDHTTDLTGSLDLRDSPHAYFYVPNVKIERMDRNNPWNYWKYRVSKDGNIQRCDSLSSGQGVVYCDDPNAVWINETPNLLTHNTKEPITKDINHTARSQSEEIQNFANWFHYYSTRMKMAKAGASEAFGRVESDIRIGYDAINNRRIEYPIPHNLDEGLFKGTNRTSFYQRLQEQMAADGTPLRSALIRTGEYYKSDDPYKDRNGTLLSCRRNYAVLVTDGAWSNEPMTDNRSTLNKIAHYYWSEDLKPSLDDNVPNIPVPDYDYANWQHMNTYSISVGMTGLLGTKTPPPHYTGSYCKRYYPHQSLEYCRKWSPSDNYVTHNSDDAHKIDDLARAAGEGYGKFFIANDTDAFAEAIDSILSTIQSAPKSASGIALNSHTLSEHTRVFSASFKSGTWSGELQSKEMKDNGAIKWLLSETFDPSKSSYHNREFAKRTVLRGKGLGNSGAVLFNDTFTDNALARTAGKESVNVANNISYLRGDQSQERKNGGNLRTRDNPIGDIVHSTPAYSNDTKTVYIGANDGMLHAISDESDGGKVLFSYIPGGVDMATLATLSSPKYEHRFFVDGSIDVMPKAHHGTKTLLLAAMGRGGRGVFSLDVSNPKAMSSAQVLWDDTVPNSNSTYMPDMGYVLGGVHLRKANGTGRKSVALIPNGIDSPNGNAALIVRQINADGSAEKEVVLSTGVGGNNGLMALALADVDHNGTVDLVYGGDLKGNVWRWDFRKKIPDANDQPVKLFSGDASRPITGGLVVSADLGKVFVGFGTGRYISLSDVPKPGALGPQQRLYGIIDHGDDNPAMTLTDANLTQRKIHGTGNQRAFDPYEPLPIDSEGWYVNLSPPERVIYPPNIAGPAMYITTTIPHTGVIEGNPCDSTSGSGFVYAINLLTGTSPITGSYFPSLGTMPVNGQQVPIGASPSVSTPTGVQLVVKNDGEVDVIYDQGNGTVQRTEGLELPDIDPEKKGRLSWREILKF